MLMGAAVVALDNHNTPPHEIRDLLNKLADALKASLDVGTVLLLLSGLSFLGIGAQPPTPEWGLEVAVSRQYMFERPWYTIASSAAIFVTVYSMNVLGDAVRSVLA